PEVRPLMDQIQNAQEALERNKEQARWQDEPALLHAARQVKKLEEQWNELWREKHDEIQQRLEVGSEDQRKTWAEKVAQHEMAIEQLRKQREAMREMIAALKVRTQDEGGKPKEAKDDEKADEPKKDAGGREASERIEQELKALKEKLGKDLDPVT